MLGAHKLVAFIATADSIAAKIFYRDALGLPLLEESEWALVFDANGITLRVQIVSDISPARHTALGWEVPDIDSAMAMLRAKGVAFERYPSMIQNEAGVWITPGGSSVAWFKDPSGNVLSLTQLAVKP
jgi:catechol 2,3-dioxygenase-like lactoylglutathione lyase family enzyme